MGFANRLLFLLFSYFSPPFFAHESREVTQADHNPARNILSRYSDPEINRYTNYREVKEILERRTESYRLELTDQDSSYTTHVVTCPDINRERISP